MPVTEDTQRDQLTSTTSAPGSPQEAIEVRTENLFQRTEVLAGMFHKNGHQIDRETYTIGTINVTPVCVLNKVFFKIYIWTLVGWY